MIRCLLFVLSYAFYQPQLPAGQEGQLHIIFWNMENFFDYRDGGEGESDREFSSFGSRHWTKKRFQAKCNAVAKTIFWLQDEYGRLPDLIGLAEMENRNVLYRLLKDTALKKTDYKFIHYDGRDRRGIDVAILYRSSLMKPVSHTRKVPVLESEDPAREDADTLDTRDILHVRMELKNGLTGHSDVDFIVNHHPSKYGGARQSDRRREAAMICLRQLCDSLAAAPSVPSSSRPSVQSSATHPPSVPLIAMGDFNDTPDSAPFRLLDGRLVNMGLPLHAKGLGTIRYEGKWDLIDMFLTDPETAERSCMEIVRVPFLMVKDSKHPGEKPLRTYSGPKYLGGVSDHCPVILMVNLQNY